MSGILLSDIETFTATRMIRIRVRTHLSAIESTTNIRVAFEIEPSDCAADFRPNQRELRHVALPEHGLLCELER
jgi:hypothetical protein